MKCINCGAEIKAEYKVCPYCGANIQIVPDYNVYDEDDINIIVENVNSIERKTEGSQSRQTAPKCELITTEPRVSRCFLFLQRQDCQDVKHLIELCRTAL